MHYNSDTATFFVGNVIWETIHLAYMYWVTQRRCAFPANWFIAIGGHIKVPILLQGIHAYYLPRIRAPGIKGYILFF